MKIENVRPLCGLVGALLLAACTAAGGEVEEPAGGPNIARDFELLSVQDKVDLLAELRAGLDAELLDPDPELLLEHEALAQTEGVRLRRGVINLILILIKLNREFSDKFIFRDI